MLKMPVIIMVLSIPSILLAASPEIPKGMQDTWVKFQDALRNDNPEELAKISKFPLHSNEFGGTIKNVTILKSRYKNIFTPKTKQCLLEQAIEMETNGKKVYFEAFCDNDLYPIRYIFEQVGARYLFVSIDNINE